MIIETSFNIISGQKCMCCKKTAAAFKSIKQIDFCYFDMKKKTVKIGYDDLIISENGIIDLVKQKGYKIEKTLQ
jgi:hypothetical protein